MRTRIGLVMAAALGLCFVAATARAQSAAETYSKNCASCHGADMKGQTPAGKAMKTPDLTAAEVRAKFDKAKLVKVISEGTDGESKHKAMKDKLTPEQISSVVDYVLAGGK